MKRFGGYTRDAIRWNCGDAEKKGISPYYQCLKNEASKRLAARAARKEKLRSAGPVWFVLASDYSETQFLCQKGDPRTMIAMTKMAGAKYKTQDVTENGRVVATTVIATEGYDTETIRFYRGKLQCYAAKKERQQYVRNALDRYN